MQQACLVVKEHFTFPDIFGPLLDETNWHEGLQKQPLNDHEIIFKIKRQPTRMIEAKVFKEFKLLANLLCSGLLPEPQYLESTYFRTRNV